jgi:hypothetical protein
MKPSNRLTFLNSIKTDTDLNELWRNCFAGTENLAHMNAHVPVPLTQQWQLNGFLTNGLFRIRRCYIVFKKEQGPNTFNLNE